MKMWQNSVMNINCIIQEIMSSLNSVNAYCIQFIIFFPSPL